jgi:hypothetical protein
MVALHPDRLDAMRVAQLRLMPAWVTLLERTTARDTGGGTTATWAPVTWARPEWAPESEWTPDTAAPAIPGRLARPTGAELALHAERLAGRPSWVVTLPYGAPVDELDHLAIDADPAPLELEVVAVLAGPTSWGTAERVLVVEP